MHSVYLPVQLIVARRDRISARARLQFCGRVARQLAADGERRAAGVRQRRRRRAAVARHLRSDDVQGQAPAADRLHRRLRLRQRLVSTP